MFAKVGDRFNIYLSRFRKIFDVDKKPLRSLGFVAMLIIAILYLVVPVATFSKEFWQKKRIINESDVTTTIINLRKTPVTLTPEDVFVMLTKYGFYDHEQNESGKGIKHAYELQATGKVVYDGATNLYWQQAGLEGFVYFEEAQNYIKKLNEDKFAGFDNWRLPTLEEAMSLMEKEKKYRPGFGHHIDVIVDKKQYYIWTSDKHDSGPWTVFFHTGTCRQAGNYTKPKVRAVR